MEILETYYNKGYRTLNKLYDKLYQKGVDISKSEVKKYIDSRYVKSRVKKYNKSLIGNKFSSISDCWQIDTYITEKFKTKYLLAINVNTRFVWCKKRSELTTDDFIKNIEEFIVNFHPKIIECDAEKSFTSYQSVIFLRKHGVILKVFNSTMNHEPLSIINRFCRTLRVESREYEKASPAKAEPPIEQIVKIYNKSYHSSIGMEPREMQNNKSNEYKYIYDQLKIRDDKNKLALEDPIKVHDKVRYILDSDRRSKKFHKDQMKYQLSKYYYLVESKNSELSFNIIAEDGSVKTVPRYKLFKLTKTEEKYLNYAPSIEDENNFQIFDEILDYKPIFKKNGDLNVDKSKYTVRIISRDKNGKKIKKNYYYTISQLRETNPTIPTKLELEFLSKNKDKYSIDKSTGYLIPI